MRKDVLLTTGFLSEAYHKGYFNDSTTIEIRDLTYKFSIYGEWFRDWILDYFTGKEYIVKDWKEKETEMGTVFVIDVNHISSLT